MIRCTGLHWTPEFLRTPHRGQGVDENGQERPSALSQAEYLTLLNNVLQCKILFEEHILRLKENLWKSPDCEIPSGFC